MIFEYKYWSLSLSCYGGTVPISLSLSPEQIIAIPTIFVSLDNVWVVVVHSLCCIRYINQWGKERFIISYTVNGFKQFGCDSVMCIRLVYWDTRLMPHLYITRETLAVCDPVIIPYKVANIRSMTLYGIIIG